MSILYINSSGKDVTHSSYSSRQTFRKCPRLFQLERIDGWSDKQQRAARIFGKCIESGIQAHEESKRTPGSGVKIFQRLWEETKLLPDFDQLVYTATEGNFEQLMRSGTEIQRLYEIKAPHLPIVRPVFQQRLRKTIFPGTNLAMLENVAVLDILSFPPWDHKLLPKIEQPSSENEQRELIIDIKTGGKEFPVELVSLDPQLAEYAWQTRIPDVAFLYLIKCAHGFRKGSRITLLEPVGVFWAGWEGVVVEMGDDAQQGAPQALYVGDYKALEGYESAVKGLRGKARDAAGENFLVKGQEEGCVVSVAASSVTKQRLQFAAARLSEEDMDEVGRSVAQTTVEMVRAHEQGFYEKQPGVRFPSEKCNFCSMRHICLHDSDARDRNLTRRGEEWLDGNDSEVE